MNWPDIIQMLIAGGLGAGGFKLADLFIMRKPKQKTDLESTLRTEIYQQLDRRDQEIAKLVQRVEQLEIQLEKTERERDFIYRKHELYKIEVHRLLAIDYNGLAVDGILIQRVLDLDKRVVDDTL